MLGIAKQLQPRMAPGDSNSAFGRTTYDQRDRLTALKRYRDRVRVHLRTNSQLTVNYLARQLRHTACDLGILEPQSGVLDPTLSGIASRLPLGPVKVPWCEIDTDKGASADNSGNVRIVEFE